MESYWIAVVLSLEHIDVNYVDRMPESVNQPWVKLLQQRYEGRGQKYSTIGLIGRRYA
jgi:hypothetical protein